MATLAASPLLELLESRWREFVSGLPDPTPHEPAKRPNFNAQGLSDQRAAATLYAEANNSDPFAYGRCLRYLRQGYWLASEVRNDALSRINARRLQGVVFPIVRLEH